MLKRAFDITMASSGLLVLSPLLVVVAVLVRMTSPGPALFRQQRMGRGFHPFTIHKFRTMRSDAPQRGGVITVGDDPRITRIGRWLRKAKLDELPQLFDVLLGHMSFVGPRPEVQKYVEMFREDYAEILQVRPGITDLASLKFRDEAAVLAVAADPELEYVHRILPEKIQFAKQYLRRQSFWFDVQVIFGTLWVLIGDRLPRRRGETRKPADALPRKLTGESQAS